MNNIYFTEKFDYDRQALAEICYKLDREDRWDGHIPHWWDTNKYTINNFTAVSYRYYPDLQDMEPVKTIREQLNFDYLDYKTTQIVKFPANHGPTIHRDKERSTAILFPIFTFEEYGPIDFYKEEDTSHWFSVDYSDSMLVFDARQLHAVTTKNQSRYSLQFDIKEPFSEVYNKYINGEFFRC